MPIGETDGVGMVVIVRHGQASFGADDYDVLSETGWAQGRLLGARLAEQDVVPTAVVRGGMRRHRETLEAMRETSGLAWPEEQIDVDWNEFDHLGILAAFPETPQGPMDRREFQRVFELATDRWAAGEVDGAPETFEGFVARTRGALARVVDLAGPGRTVLVVTSGGPIGVCAATLVDPAGADLAQTARLWQRFNTVVANSGYSRVVVGSTGPRLLTFNEHAHLDAVHLTYR